MDSAAPQRSLPAEFNEFLQIRDAELELLAGYRDALIADADQFATLFYDYLLAFPATADVLHRYRAEGGDIGHLACKQVNHLLGLLNGGYAAMPEEYIGQVHFRRGIEPVWIMGAYRLYLDHLQGLITRSPHIADRDRGPLEDVVVKLLFRDMGLVLEGYWQAATGALEAEKSKVESLQQQISDLLANIPQLLWSVDVANNRMLYCSPSTRAISLGDAELPIPCLGWTVDEDKPGVEQAWQQALQGMGSQVESRVHAEGGGVRWFRRYFHPYRDKQGDVIRIDGLMEEITDFKRTLAHLEHLATTDTLTGLANRALWNEEAQRALARARRHGSAQVAVLLLDLNLFKHVNDTMGHSVGDDVLVQVGHRLKHLFRESDVLARLGGDEFAVLLPCEGQAFIAARQVAQKILACFKEPFRVGRESLTLSAALGVAVFPEHGDDITTLFRRADVAMYAAKRNDVGYLFYTPSLDEADSGRLQLSGQLGAAIAAQELELHYQPKIDLYNDQVRGVEALVRWRHPQHGLIMPQAFIPLAEQHGMIVSLTQWVLQAALSRHLQWAAAGIQLPVAVNVAARCFHNPGHLLRNIHQALDETGAAPAALEIEITENTLISDVDRSLKVLERLSHLGVAVTIDDFGTGYSSLSYLKRLPIKTLKIDKSFVLDLNRNPSDLVIVRAIIDLGHNLGIDVVAEGVENPEAFRILRELGCDAVQGYHFTPPLPHQDFESWLERYQFEQTY